MPPRIYNFQEISCKNEACISSPAAQVSIIPEFIRKDASFVCRYCEREHSYEEIWDVSLAQALAEFTAPGRTAWPGSRGGWTPKGSPRLSWTWLARATSWCGGGLRHERAEGRSAWWPITTAIPVPPARTTTRPPASNCWSSPWPSIA
jgi:hypothetical protein